MASGSAVTLQNLNVETPQSTMSAFGTNGSAEADAIGADLVLAVRVEHLLSEGEDIAGRV